MRKDGIYKSVQTMFSIKAAYFTNTQQNKINLFLTYSSISIII
jgi:hypothetical protein